MADEFIKPVYDHICKDIRKRNPFWWDFISMEKGLKERYNVAKKIVWISVRETKDPYMREKDVSAIASDMVWRRGAFKYD